MELAGDKMVVRQQGETTVYEFNDVGTGRVCGSCTACCKLMPVPTINKPAGQRCQHQRYGKGCTIYANRPFACRTWSCAWLSDPTTSGMPRPDRAHYVIDVTWDHITMRDEQTGALQHVPVVQVWVDPAFRSAYKSPELREFMAEMGIRHGAATLVRWNSREDALVVFPPALGGWCERADGTVDARSPEERRRDVSLEHADVVR